MSELGKVRESFTLPEVTRITVVTDEGRAFERYDAFEGGVEVHLQDGGRTLKIFPKRDA